MSDLERRLQAPQDPRGRLVSIFVGAVLLPSIALSALSFHAVPKHAESLEISLLKQAEKVLYYIEKDLEMTARSKALEAARNVGPERLLEGRPEVIRTALDSAGMQEAVFDNLRLEAWSPVKSLKVVLAPGADELRLLKEALKGGEALPGPEGEDSVPLTTADGTELGILRFRFACGYAHTVLVREFFEKNPPEQAWVIRVTEPDGSVLWENAPTPSGAFEKGRVMMAPSFRGLKLELRNRERSIKQEVRRLAVAKTALIGFIDLMLLAGLYLAYTNVRREIHLARLKSDFVANVSHELKTPLALIRLFAETLELGRVQGAEKAKQYYRIINKESQRLTQLINNILDFSRIEAGRREYRMVPSDIGAVVRDVVESYRFAIEKLGFSLELSVGDELPPLELDPEAISQAVINLLNNAIKYSSEQKSIKVSVRRELDRVLLSVSDRGIGIPRSEHRRIFEKFYRVETSLLHTTKGSGLGLALVQHITEAHGGRVELASAPGEGSTFTLSLPVPPEPVAAEEPSPARGTMEPREVEERP
jgi:signal transduction histidine kinase